MEKGIEAEEDNLYKQTEDVAENVLEDLNGINSNLNISNDAKYTGNKLEFDYDKLSNSMLKALTGCKFTLDEDGFAKIVKDELYKVV